MITHQHLIMKLNFNTDKPNRFLTDEDLGNEVLTELVLDILDMKIAIPARSVLVRDPDNFGTTGAINLTTSHISYHCWRSFCTMDVYSCKDFSNKKVMYYLKQKLGNVISIEYRVIDRSRYNEYDRTYIGLTSDGD